MAGSSAQVVHTSPEGGADNSGGKSLYILDPQLGADNK